MQGSEYMDQGKPGTYRAQQSRKSPVLPGKPEVLVTDGSCCEERRGE